MDAKKEASARVERKNDREVVTTRSFDAPARIVFEAWTQADLFKLWWIPKSTGMTLLSCELDVRVGGGYRLEIKHPHIPQPMAFFGKYTEVIPNSRMVWTNEESDDGPLTTVTFLEKDGKTLVTVHELFPSKEALEGAGGCSESLEQLAEFLPTQGEK